MCIYTHIAKPRGLWCTKHLLLNTHTPNIHFRLLHPSVVVVAHNNPTVGSSFNRQHPPGLPRAALDCTLTRCNEYPRHRPYMRRPTPTWVAHTKASNRVKRTRKSGAASRIFWVRRRIRRMRYIEYLHPNPVELNQFSAPGAQTAESDRASIISDLRIPMWCGTESIYGILALWPFSRNAFLRHYCVSLWI